MAALFYGKYIVISRPRYDEELGTWVPYASVTLDGIGDAFYYHQFDELEKAFATEDEALAYGFAVAGRWIDKEQ